MELNQYFSEENVIKLLCKYRANAANKRHDTHMMRNISVHASTNKINITDKHTSFKFLQSIFPCRRQWLKLKQSERKICRDALSINKRRLYKSYELTKLNVDSGIVDAPVWFNNLITFVEKLRQEVLSGNLLKIEIASPVIKGIKKEEKNGVIIYRPIALYDFSSKIICSITARYLTHYFEAIFHGCSYAFRGKNVENKIPNHHDCIDAIAKYRKQNNKLWVAECDIQKFFDTVQHKHLLDVFEKLSNEIEQKTSNEIDLRAVAVFRKFLESFSFQEDVMPLNDNDAYFSSNNMPKGKFGWVEEELVNEFGEAYVKEFRIGVPQGNAISCFVSNLILHEVDKAVLESTPIPFYIRYCDDMILMHSNEEACASALDIYKEEIRRNFLLFHEPIDVLDYRKKEIGKAFWKVKSKKPFFWGDKNAHSKNVPWVSFVGYQMNFQGNLRVRKSTIKKEVNKQISETQKVLKALGKFNRRLIVKSENARLPSRHISFRLAQKLISMSVGRVKIHSHKKPSEQGLCWTNGFKMLNHNRITSQQLRYLDKRRNMQLIRIKREIAKINKTAKQSQYPEHMKSIFFGSAFAYYNFLKHK